MIVATSNPDCQRAMKIQDLLREKSWCTLVTAAIAVKAQIGTAHQQKKIDRRRDDVGTRADRNIKS